MCRGRFHVNRLVAIPGIARFGFRAANSPASRKYLTTLHPAAYARVWRAGVWHPGRCSSGPDPETVGSVPRSDRSGDDVRDLSAIVAYLSRTRGRTGRDGPFTRLTTTRERVAYASSRTAYASSRAPRRRLTDARGRTRQPVWRWCRSDERRRHDAREPR